VTQWQCAAASLDVVVWAEHVVVPFKAELRRVSEEQENELWGYRDENGVGLAAMIEVYEARLAEAQPNLYCNFGIQLLFEELGLKMRKECWAVNEEDVGVPGLILTFNLATTYFAPSRWGE
jgi:hypothetical protein